MRRRRLLRLLGIGAAGLAFGDAARREPEGVRWRGAALGAAATIELFGVARDRAESAIAAALEELARLEAVFSLFDPESALSRLNRERVLRRPPLELLEVLALARRLAVLGEGAFDPTIQPLWLAVARGASRAERRAAHRLVDWRALEASPEAVVLHRRGMAVTLDGIAQGYLTDRVAEVLRGQGITRVLVDLGELRVAGGHPSGRPWRIGRRGLPPVEIVGGAVASSVAILDGVPRILDPRTGEPPPLRGLVTVVAPEAVVADGLSTALCVLGPERGKALLAAFPGARLSGAVASDRG